MGQDESVVPHPEADMCRAADGGMATHHTGADPSFSHTPLGVRRSRTHTTDNHKGEGKAV